MTSTHNRRGEEAEEKGANGSMITIRHYRHPQDLAPIRQIFVEATTQGRGSPIVEGNLYFSPHTRLAYAAAALGIVLTAVSTSRWMSSAPWVAPMLVFRLGIFLCSVSIAVRIYVWYHRRIIKHAFGVFLEEGLKGELGDVVKSYDLRITAGRVCVPTGPRGFWVAEEAGEIIGMVGLNNNIMGPDPKVAEVRRLVVSSRHRGKRVAEKLMDAVVVHARAHTMQALGLVTSDYHKSAQRFYTRIGWKVVGRKDWEGLSLWVMRQELGDSVVE